MVAGWGSGFLAFWAILGMRWVLFAGCAVTAFMVTVLVVTVLAVTMFVACPGAGC